MNCQDIAEILDNGKVTRPGEAGKSAVDRHLEGCADCAREWRLHGEFAALRDLVMPAGFESRCRALVAALPPAGRGRRARGRFILVGTLVAVAAAAGMLAWVLAGFSGPPATTQVPPAAPAVTTPGLEAAGPPGPTPADTAEALPARYGTSEPVPEPARFTVHVLPLINNGEDATTTAAIATFHAALLDQLRLVPGLMLVQVNAPEDLPASGRYPLTILGMGSGRDNEISVLVGLDVRTAPDGSMSGRYMSSMAGPAVCAAAAEPESCLDPVRLAAAAVTQLRTTVFPADQSLQREIKARLLDATLDPAQRFRALHDLGQLGGGTGEARAALRDPAVWRGATELAAVTTDAGQRAEIWRGMRGVGDAELIRSLIDAARMDPERQVRVEAMATLAADFAADSRARVALESAAREDASGLVRAIAQRALSGEEGWKSYILASLADTSAPALDRVAALLHHTYLPSPVGTRSRAPWSWYGALLDDDATAALTSVLPAAMAEASPGDKSSLTSLALDLCRHSRHPAVTRMLVDAIEGRLPGLGRHTAVMAAGHRDDEPLIREALQRIAAEDADEKLREAARRLVGREAGGQ